MSIENEREAEEVDAGVGAILAGMHMVPAKVRSQVLSRLGRILQAIGDDMMRDGTTMIGFRDLWDEDVVITMTVSQHFAHLNVSDARDGTVVSRGYDILSGDKGVITVVNEDAFGGTLDHTALAEAHRATDARLDSIRVARDSMLSLPGFGAGRA